ncbi:CHAT domain-containing protein [Nostoc punctiforme]|uniref:TPR repeat-containing protein n=1 Tax=Nostoc punctiforme (strain ATCC 29133 / PCC 73102) TaxID=63737 RepID=B2J381_NOSP7|nr:CHAT domain-containing tetratricopeptide repeat protein [Nostoc punctiforme]ACC83531.1 TPR repeat-containing protein [Nostoc punctiforme PCC 73102]
MIEERINFLLTALIKISQSYSDKKIVYPLLQDNLDKLDLNFAVLLRHWAKNYFAGENLYNAQTVAAAAAIGNFCTLIGQFPHGNIADNLDIAIACCEVIEIIFTREEYPIEWAISKLNLGNAYGNRIYGDPTENREKAIAAYQDALKIYSREEYPIEWAETQTNLIPLYSAKIKHIKKDDNYVNLDKLVSICNAVLEIFTLYRYIEKWVIVKNNLASLYCDTPHRNLSNNFELAIDIYKEVLGVLNKESFTEECANTHMNMGIAYDKRVQGDRQENFNLAVQAYQNSLKFYTRDNYPFTYAILQNNLGNAYRDQGLATSAINYYWLALEIHTHTAYPNESLRASRNLGNTAFKSGYWDEAIKGYSIAIKAVETSRSWIKSESRRQKILEESIGIYESMVQACINAGQIEKAFEYSERSRSKRLVDLMASNNLYQSGEIPPAVAELLQQYEELQQIIGKERQSHKSENNRSDTRAAWEAYNEAIALLETQKQQVWENLRREDPVLAGEIQVNPLSLSEIQKLIDQPNTAILSFYTTNSDTHIFVVQKDQITLHTCTGQGLNTLQGWIEQNWLLPYRDEPKKWETQINSILCELAERLQISQLISQHLQGIEELILVPHLLLHQIPFAALPTGEYQEYLGDKFLIRYTPSCQILEFCQQRNNVGTFNGTSLEYGTVEDAEDNLPCARFEGEKLAQMYNIPSENRLIGSSQATSKNYRQLAQQVQVLHSCHHAQSCLDNPLESQLKLAQDSSITLGQLMTPSWRLPQLVEVFLSCCETNLGTPSLTDDILTLSTGFLCAGARSVVSTLWSVNDLATALFSIFYYQQRQEGKNRPEALQKAQIKLRDFKKVDLNKIFHEVEAKEKKLIVNRKKYPSDSIEYQQWKFEYNMYAQLNRRIKEIENSTQQFPFSDPHYWAAFICHGLR